MNTKMQMRVSASGIGDAVCGLYAAAGAANVGFEVEYFTKQPHWLTRASHPGVTILPYEETGCDVYERYDESLRVGADRKQWYCENLMHAFGGEIRPSAPQDIDAELKVEHFGPSPYATISPYSAWRGREWPAVHWRRLATLLFEEQGITPLFIGSHQDSERLGADFGSLPSFSKIMWGYSPDSVCDFILGSSVFIGNDSGMTHLAALLKVPTVAIHSQLRSEVLWSCTNVKSATPDEDVMKCSFCRFDHAKGYRGSCMDGCAALATVSPQQVLEKILAVVNVLIKAVNSNG